LSPSLNSTATTGSRKVVLFGARGLLGSGIARALAGRTVTALHWDQAGNLDPSSDSFAALCENADLVFANGITDPNRSESEIEASNLKFPIRVIQALEASKGAGRARYLTFGTIQEHFPEACRANPYLRSKLNLGQWMSSRLREQAVRGRYAHIQLHTLYGREPKPYSFLGQILKALRGGGDFTMSAGEQLREYHHVDDIAHAIANLMVRDWTDLPVPLDLSSGDPIRLADLAREIFVAMGREKSLKVGALATPPGENREKIFERSPYFAESRATIPGVIASLRAYV